MNDDFRVNMIILLFGVGCCLLIGAALVAGALHVPTDTGLIPALMFSSGGWIAGIGVGLMLGD